MEEGRKEGRRSEGRRREGRNEMGKKEERTYVLANQPNI
jgi:hypothetical protein